MSGVDDRIVNMRFNNSTFEGGVKTTLGTLARLKQSLNFSGSKKSLNELQSAGNKFNMGNMGVSIQGISGKLLAMSTIGVTALATITSKAIQAGSQLVKSLSITPILDGYHEYETQLNSIQTILANTQSDGTNITQVNDALNQLNTYSDKTIYNFGEMARNIGTFTAAGVKLNTSVSAIKGIANVAALSGSSSDQASTAMYQLSQAIANNKVGLQDWNSVVNAGMGGKVFQEALFNVGKLKGTLKGVDANTTFDQWTKSGNSFRDSLKSGWITGNVLTTTLKQFTGDMTDAQLKSMGYNAAQIKQIQKQAKAAQDAATKVKTFTQLMGTLKEAVGSGWAQSFGIIFGNFDEAKDLWTGVSQSIGGLISKSANARNKILKDWKALGGRKILIEAIRKAFSDLGDIVGPIKKAFRDIFPAKTGRDLFNLTVRFRDFMNNLALGEDTMTNLRRSARGVFAVFDIIWHVITGVGRVFVNLFKAVSGGQGGFLSFTGNIGDMLVALDKALVKGGALARFFDGFGNILSVPLIVIGAIKDAILTMFSGFNQGDANGVTDAVGAMGDKLTDVSVVGEKIADLFHRIGDAAQPLAKRLADAFGNIGTAIANSVKGANFDQVMSVIQTSLLGGLVLLIKKFFSNGINVDIGGGMLGTIKDSFETLTGSMKAMQTQIKARTLLMIAGAIALLTASVVALSFINPDKLTVALKAMAVGFGELLGAMAILTKISGSAGFIKVPLIAASMILLAAAITLLTVAVRNLSSLSWQELEKGLTAVGILLAVISAASIPLSANSAGMIRSGIGIAAIAVAMNLLYFAVKNFSKLSWKELEKGLVAVASSLVGIAVAMRLMPPGMALQSAGILEISLAVNALYLAVKNFSKLSWKEMGKGLAGVAGSLAGIALAMKLMPKGIVLQAAGLVIVSGALLILAKAIGIMGRMSFETIGKGLGTIAAALAILAGGLYLMEGALPGAAALLIAAGALRVLMPVLEGLGAMSWKSIIKGLVALAASFVVLGLGALALAPVAPALLAIGAAIALIGIGIGAAAAGIGLLSTGLGALAGLGTAGIGVLVSAIKGFIEMIPEAAAKLAEGLVQMIVVIGKNAPAIIAAIVKIVSGLLDAVVKLAPKMGVAITAVIQMILNVLIQNAPKIIAAGFQLLLDLLKGIRDNIGKIVGTVADIIVNFLNALANNMPRIIAAGVRLLTKLLVGIASALGKMPGIVLQVIGAFLSSLFGNFGKIFSGGARMLGRLISGIGSRIGDVGAAAIRMVSRFVSAIASKGGDLAGAGVRMVGRIVHGIVSDLGEAAQQVGLGAWDIGKHIIEGIWEGIKNMGGWLKDKVTSFVDGVLGDIGDFLGIGGPAKAVNFVGEGIVLGIMDGMDNFRKPLDNKVANIAKTTVDALNDAMTQVSDAISANVDHDPKITPILDLSNVRRGAAELNGLMSSGTLSAKTSFINASAISREQALVAQASSEPVVVQQAGPTFQFQQTNTSPKALSTIEIYRQTRNQLALAKSALGVND